MGKEVEIDKKGSGIDKKIEKSIKKGAESIKN